MSVYYYVSVYVNLSKNKNLKIGLFIETSIYCTNIL